MLMKKIATAAATGAMLLATFAPSAFASSVSITGNGKHSTNTATVTTTNVNSLSQSNNTTVTSFVNSSANSGGNKANDNLGGGSIMAGPATSAVGISVGGSTNTAPLLPCGCNLSDPTVTISGNLKYSKNTATISQTTVNSATQTNTTTVTSFVNSNANSGGNKANDNLGGGSISTDTATSSVGITVEGGTNM